MGQKRTKQKELSDLTGIRPATISALWNGTTKQISIEQIGLLCDALECSPGDLFDYTPKVSSNESDDY